MGNSKEYMRKYKQKLKIEKRIIIMCECGLSHRRDNLTKHKRTNKHIKLLKEKQSNMNILKLSFN